MKIIKEELIQIIKEEVEKFQLEKGIADSNRVAYDQEKRADEHASDARLVDGDAERQAEMAVDFYTGAYDEFNRQFLIGRRLMRDGKKSMKRIISKVARLEKIVPGSKMSFEIRENVED